MIINGLGNITIILSKRAAQAKAFAH